MTSMKIRIAEPPAKNLQEVICYDCEKTFTLNFEQEAGVEEYHNLRKEMIDILELSSDGYLPDTIFLCISCIDYRMINYEVDNKDLTQLIEIIKSNQLAQTFPNKSSEMDIKDLQALEKEELQIDYELGSLEDENSNLTKKLFELIKERHDVDQMEEKFWGEMSSLEKQQLELQKTTFHADQQISHYQYELDRLSNFSMLNDVFEIRTNEELPSLSRLKMGYQSEMNSIIWDETNAGFGQLLLLINFLMIKHSIRGVEGTKLKPMGSNSYIIVSQESQEIKCDLWGPPRNEVTFFVL